MPQATLAGYEDGQPEPETLGESGPQTTISDGRHDDARIDIPDCAGPFERVTARRTGAVVKWLCPRESVTVIRIIGDGPAFEVIAAETAAASPGRVLVECEDRDAAIDEAVAYMEAEGTDCREG
jgi:hypothetical protein